MSAVFSPCGMYRYRLRREWLTGSGSVCWVMLNPSTADAAVDDPTIRRVVGFSQRWGFQAAEVVNLYAYRTPYPKDLRDAAEVGVDIVGSDNDRHIVDAAYDARRVVTAWGANEPANSPRVRAVVGLLAELGVWRIGCCGGGQPRHPLIVSYGAPLEPWEPR